MSSKNFRQLLCISFLFERLMGCKWRLLFLISPEVLSSTHVPIDHLILSLLLKCFVLSTTSLPKLSNIEWNIHLLASSLNLMNRNFLPLSTTSVNTLIIKLSNFVKSEKNIKSINSQDLWNGLIQSLYSPSWDPAEILSPVKRTFKSLNCRRTIFIIGSFPSSQEQINSFFTTKKNCLEIKKLSSLFLKEVLPPDLNKSLSSQCIHLIWINTNPHVSPISTALQKSIKQIKFVCIRLLYPSNISTPPLPFIRFNDFNSLPVASTNYTNYPCTLHLLDHNCSIQAKIYSFNLLIHLLTVDICQRFISKQDVSVSFPLTSSVNSVLSVRLLACIKAPILDILNLFDLDLVSFITFPNISQISSMDYDFLIFISNVNGDSYIAFMRLFSNRIAYCFKITEICVLSPKLGFPTKYVPMITKSDLRVSPILVDIDFINNFSLKEFAYFLLSPVYSFCYTNSSSFLPTSSTSPEDTDLLDWIENDLVVYQNTSLKELYLKTRPHSCDAASQLIQLRSSMHTLKIESAQNDDMQVERNKQLHDRIDAFCDILFTLMSTIHDAEKFSDRAYSLVKSIDAQADFNEIGGLLLKRLFSKYVLQTLQQIKEENCSIDQRSNSIQKQVVIRFLLFPSLHIYETDVTSREFISEVVSLLRYLTISTSPTFVTDFMLNSLVKNCDLNLELQKEFLRELYDSLGNQPPEVLGDSSFLHVSGDFIFDLNPVSPSTFQLPSTHNEKEDKFVRHQSFPGLFADNSREISVANRNASPKRSLSKTVDFRCKQMRNFKRTLFDTEPKNDSHRRTDRKYTHNGSRSAGTPNKKVKVLCEETPMNKRSSNRLLNKIRREQKRSGFSPSKASVTLESPQRVFYSESSTLSWRQIPNDRSHLTPEKHNSVLSVFHSPLLAYKSVSLQLFESPFNHSFDPLSKICPSPVLQQETNGFIYNSTPYSNCVVSPTVVTSNCKIDLFITPTKYST